MRNTVVVDVAVGFESEAVVARSRCCHQSAASARLVGTPWCPPGTCHRQRFGLRGEAGTGNGPFLF
jgi:hypothetical protein